MNKTVLPNGVRILSEHVPYVQSVSIGIWIGSGSRDEDDSSRGISHFIEHMLFKGTERRTARQIADELDSVGGQLNAFTDKEYTCFYAKVLSEHLPLAIDVLSDMLMHSLLDLQEIVVERKVVLEEIKRHEDTPEDSVHDEFAAKVWGDHPLGKPVLGTEKSIRGALRADILEYMQSHYSPDCIVVSAAGLVKHEELVKSVETLFGGLKGSKAERICQSPVFSYESELCKKRTEQVHFCIGAPGCSQLDPDRYSLAVIDTTLGGGMSSRLFQEIREKRGLAYAIGSYSALYKEGGIFAIYGGTSLENLEEVVGLVKAEFGNIKKNNITSTELEKAKNQMRGGLVLSQESMSNRMMRMAKSELYFGRIIDLQELINNILKVSLDDIERVATRMFVDSNYPVVALGPFKKRKAEANE